MNNKTKIVFAGTPEFAVPFLEKLASDADFEIVGIITQPDKPAGRKQTLTPPPIKELAIKHGFKIFQPETLKDNLELADELKTLGADIMVVVAYGLIIPQVILDIFPRGNINVHPSLLPRHRGASPVQAAILAGDDVSGVTIMLMDERMDHGPILAQEQIALTGEETNESLHQKMAEIGRELLLDTTKKYLAGKIAPQAQDDNMATFCRPIKREDARIDWQKTAEEISRQIRAYYPWPGTWAELSGRRIKIFPPVRIISDRKEPGMIFESSGQLAVGAGNGSIIVGAVQLEGKNKTNGQDFLRGYREAVDKILK